MKDNSFIDWASQKELLFQELHPWERTRQFLIEIHKRVLAEQVLILNWQKGSKHVKVLQKAPVDEADLPDAKLQKKCVDLCIEHKSLLTFENLSALPDLNLMFEEHQIYSILISPLHIQESSSDVLVIVNHAITHFPGKISEFVAGISSVLGLALENARFYDELKAKTRQLKNWSRDVERRIQEGTKRLLEQEFQFHALFEGANDGIIVHHRDGRIFEANQVACQLLGYSRKDLVNMKWAQMTVAKEAEIQNRFFDHVLRKKTDRPLECRLLKSNGNTFYAEISSRRVWFHGQETIQSFIRNISLRKQLEISIKESKNKYRTLVESSLMGVFNVRGNNILFANGQLETLSGYTKEELFNVGFSNLIHPDDRSWVTDRERRRENGEEVPEQYEVRFICKNKKTLWCDLRACRILQGGQPTILGNIIDINERKKMARELLETKKMESISTLAGGIAHDFNNLLGGILGYASLLLSDMTPAHPYYNDIDTISKTAKRAAELTSRLLAFARGGKYQVKALTLNKSINKILPIIRESVDQSVELELFLADDLWPVKGDSQQLQQAILNICINGLEALGGSGRLAIYTDNVKLNHNYAKEKLGLEGGDYVRTVIRDSGKGMDQKTLMRIFEPFFTTKTVGDGAGLGMAMVYGVVKNHGGSIRVDSEMQKGTAITFFLPRLSDVPHKVSATPQVQSRLSHRILLVDDELVIREVGQRMLEKGGFKITTAPDGTDALEIYKKEGNEIDLVLLDWMMPKMGGKETARRIKEINPNALICFLSGYSPQDKPELLQMGDQYFIQKPFQTDILIKTIQKILTIPTD